MYDLPANALAELASGDAFFVSLVTIEVDDDTTWRWSDSDAAWEMGGHRYASTGTPLIGVVRPRMDSIRQINQVHISDPSRTYAALIKAAGQDGLPISIVEYVVVGGKTLSPIYTMIGVTSGLFDAPSKKGELQSNTILTTSGRTVKPGSVKTRYAADDYQQEEVDATDTIFRRIHQGLKASWGF